MRSRQACQRQKCRARLFVGLLEDRVDCHGVTLIVGRVSQREAGSQRVQTLLRLCQRDTGRQTGEAVAPRCVQGEWNPRLHVVELVAGSEAAAGGHGLVEDAEVIGRDSEAAQDFGTVEAGEALPGPIELGVLGEGGAVEQAGFAAVVPEIDTAATGTSLAVPGQADDVAGVGYGGGATRTVWAIVKTAVAAPMPRTRVPTARSEVRGLRRIRRNA